VFPVGSTVATPVGELASTIPAVLASWASPRKSTLRYQTRTPVEARSATASSQRPAVRKTATTTPSTAVASQSRALSRV
jgi:hypothetical protein